MTFPVTVGDRIAAAAPSWRWRAAIRPGELSATPTGFHHADRSVGRDGKGYPRRLDLRKLRPDAELFTTATRSR